MDFLHGFLMRGMVAVKFLIFQRIEGSIQCQIKIIGFVDIHTEFITANLFDLLRQGSQELIEFLTINRIFFFEFKECELDWRLSS